MLCVIVDTGARESGSEIWRIVARFRSDLRTIDAQWDKLQASIVAMEAQLPGRHLALVMDYCKPSLQLGQCVKTDKGFWHRSVSHPVETNKAREV